MDSQSVGKLVVVLVHYTTDKAATEIYYSIVPSILRPSKRILNTLRLISIIVHKSIALNFIDEKSTSEA